MKNEKQKTNNDGIYIVGANAIRPFFVENKADDIRPYGL